MARRATLIDETRNAAEHLLVLDAGHALLGDSIRSYDAPGEVSAQALDLMGYDAVALGSADLAALRVEGMARIRETHAFALLSANAYPEGSERLAAEPYTVWTIGDQRVAVLGLTDAKQIDGWSVQDPLQAARQWTRHLRREADIIILLSHAGLSVNREIASKVRGIDVIVVGGNQLLDEPIRMGADDTLLLHADRYTAGLAGQNIGVGTLFFDGQGRLTDYEWARLPLGADIAPSRRASEWLLELARQPSSR